MPLQQLAETRRHYGALATFGWLSSRCAAKLLCLEVNELFYLDAASFAATEKKCSRPLFCGGLEAKPRFTFRFLATDEIIRFAQNPANQLQADFVARALRRGDQCMAAVDGDHLAAYSWYARHWVDGADHLGLSMSLPAEMAYMYNAFTHPAYRGLKLFKTGVTLAFEALQFSGVQKLIATVNNANFTSLRSCRGMGFSSLGQIWTFGRGKHRFTHTPTAARQMGISFQALR
jgi:hypothetical protein